MPLKAGKSQKVISQNIREMHQGEMYEKVMKKHGAAKAHQVAVAAAMRKAREG